MKNSLNFYFQSYNKNSKNYDKTYFFLNNYRGEAKFINNLIKLNSMNPDEVKLLDLGCGTGNLFLYLPKLEKIGVDISENMIKEANSKKILKARFICEDLLNLHFREKFKIIYISTFLIQTFKSFKTLENFLNSLIKNLSKEGIIIFSWIDEEDYKKRYSDGRFSFKLKNNWSCSGESSLKNKQRSFNLKFVNQKNEKIESSAKYLIISGDYLKDFSEKINMKLKIYNGKRNGLKESYQKWCVLYK